jgi:calcineurin-like phosphoesterase family protein
MDREIIRRWNERVKPNDTVIHMGDFGFLKGEKNFEYYRQQLNGNLVLFKGNHDNNNSMNSILQCGVITYGGLDWWCEHQPMFKFEHNLCAHVHTLWRVSKQGSRLCVNVGMPQWDYRPIDIHSIIQVEQEFKKQSDFKW